MWVGTFITGGDGCVVPADIAVIRSLSKVDSRCEDCVEAAKVVGCSPLCCPGVATVVLNLKFDVIVRYVLVIKSVDIAEGHLATF